MARKSVRPATNHDVTCEMDWVPSSMVLGISRLELPGPTKLPCPLAALPCLHRYAIICVRTLSSSVVGGACANLTGWGGTVSGMVTRTVAAGSGAGFDASCVLARTFFPLWRGGLTSCVFARTFFSLL